VALATRFDLNISQLDVETAYLNRRIDTEIFMEKPELLYEMLRIEIEEENCEVFERARRLLQRTENPDSMCKTANCETDSHEYRFMSLC